MGKYRMLLMGIAGILVVSLISLPACSSGSGGTPGATQSGPQSPGGPGGGAIIQSNSVVTGQVEAVRSNAYGYPWEVDFTVITSNDVRSLPNPTRDHIGQKITAKSDEDLSGLTKGTKFTANVKLIGDVPLPGISFYVYNVKVTK
jgi:hypothetical protein